MKKALKKYLVGLLLKYILGPLDKYLFNPIGRYFTFREEHKNVFEIIEGLLCIYGLYLVYSHIPEFRKNINMQFHWVYDFVTKDVIPFLFPFWS